MSLSTWDHSVHALRQAIPNPQRWTHIWGVIETAMALAERHGVDVTRTAWAALLHDGAKCLDKAALERLLREHDLAEDPDDWQYPAVWHA